MTKRYEPIRPPADRPLPSSLDVLLRGKELSGTSFYSNDLLEEYQPKHQPADPRLPKVQRDIIDVEDDLIEVARRTVARLGKTKADINLSVAGIESALKRIVVEGVTECDLIDKGQAQQVRLVANESENKVAFLSNERAAEFDASPAIAIRVVETRSILFDALRGGKIGAGTLIAEAEERRDEMALAALSGGVDPHLLQLARSEPVITFEDRDLARAALTRVRAGGALAEFAEYMGLVRRHLDVIVFQVKLLLAAEVHMSMLQVEQAITPEIRERVQAGRAQRKGR